MAWPTNKPDSNAFASDTNSIKESRPELNTMSQAVNDIVDFVDTSGIQNGDVLVYDSTSGTIKPGTNYQLLQITAGNNITVDQDSAGGVIISSTGGGITDIVAGTGISVTQPDSGGAVTISSSVSGLTNPLTADLNVGGYKIIDSTSVKLEAPEIHIQASAGTPVLEFQATEGLIQSQSNSQRIRFNDTGNKLHFYSINAISINDFYTLPAADGTSGQVLTTNGAGTVSFQTPSGGAGATTEITAGDNITVTQPDSAGAFEIGFSNPLTNPVNVNNQSINDPVFKGYSELVYTGLSTSGTLTPDVSNGNVQVVTLSGNITINSLSGVANGDSVTIIIKQPGAGGPYTLSSTMKFAGGSKTLSTTANAIDVLSIFYDGTDYLASLSTNFS
jgi:hypothetical protein